MIPTELLSWGRNCGKGMGTQEPWVSWAPRGPSGFQEGALSPPPPALSGKPLVALGTTLSLQFPRSPECSGVWLALFTRQESFMYQNTALAGVSQ